MFNVKQPLLISDIPDCPGIQCLNGGTCNDGIAAYNCSCVDGFTGEHCETSKDFLIRSVMEYQPDLQISGPWSKCGVLFDDD